MSDYTYPDNLESLESLSVTSVYGYDICGSDEGVSIEFSDGRTLCIGYSSCEGETILFEKDEPTNGRK